METLLADLRYAVRSLRNAPGFTLVAILTLSLGIGANAAIFSVVNGVLLEPLPYKDPGRLVTVNHYYPSLNALRAPVSVPGFRDYSARTDLFSAAAIENYAATNLTGSGEPERIIVARVSGQFFPLLGVAPIVGRALQPDEAQPGKDHVAVLTYGFWQRKFGGSQDVLKQSLILNNESYQVVGVLPATFKDFFAGRTDAYTPVWFKPEDMADNRRTNEFLPFIGRLAPGVSLDKAQADMHAMAVQLRTQYTANYSPDWDLLVTPLAVANAQNIRTSLLLLLGAVTVVLLISCANVANLQLARTAARARDVAVRVALGASPRRLVRLLLTESLVLALAGGGLGILLAVWGVPALLALNNGNLPATAHISISLPVLGFTLLVSLATGFLFGLAPALQMARTNLHESLKEGGRGAVSQRGSLAMRRGLVISTVALALTLLVGAGLLIRSFAQVVGVDPGFKTDHLLTFNLSLPVAKYPNDTVRLAAYSRITSSIASAPGVLSAGGTSNIPFAGNFSTGSFTVEGYQVPANAPGPWGDIRAVTPAYFATMKAPLMAGRQFTDADRMDAPSVCIVDQEMVDRYWPHTDPIGKRVTFSSSTAPNIQWITVVGVVGHLAHEGLDAQKRVQLYLPLAQNPRALMGFTVRTVGDPLAATATIRRAVASVDPDLPLAAPASMESLVDSSLGSRRFAMLLLGGFALLALVLASVGLYGVMSYTVTQRAREMGVRLALGAGTGAVLGLVLRQGVNLTLLGVGIGIATAFALTRVMKTMLFGVGATDPLTFLTLPLVLIAVALLATYLPARRATRTDPIVALRAE
jgi:predicted permease